jgi:hypothetical protein
MTQNVVSHIIHAHKLFFSYKIFANTNFDAGWHLISQPMVTSIQQVIGINQPLHQ